MLDAVSRVLIHESDLPALSLPASPDFPPSVDLSMVDMAIKIAACTERGDCERAALENLDCKILNACVRDLRNFARERIFGPKQDRAAFVKFIDIEPNKLERRWQDATEFAARLHGKTN